MHLPARLTHQSRDDCVNQLSRGEKGTKKKKKGDGLEQGMEKKSVKVVFAGEEREEKRRV